jgi:hypothetical protein
MRSPLAVQHDQVMSSSRSLVIRVALRSAAVLLAAGGAAFAYRALGIGPTDASADADFGGGWAMLAAVVLLAAAWGAWDGWHRRIGAVALTWLATGVVVGVTALLLIDWGASHQVFLTDLPLIPTFVAALVLLPALAVSAVVAGVRPYAHPG